MASDTPSADQRRAETHRAETRDAHSVPRGDLRTHPWIRVHLADRTVTELGLEELLLRAHEVTDLAEPDPLTRAALRRWLTALTAILVRHDGAGHEAWSQRLDTNSGFSAGQVQRLLDHHADHLWLYHPRTPFLQDRRLLEAMTKPLLSSVAELIAHLPGASEAAWFSKPNDPQMRYGLSHAETARALVTRWFYTLNGNTAVVKTSAGTEKSHAGSAFNEGLRDATHAFRVSPISLFATLLRNLTTELVTGTGDTPAWMDPDQPQTSASPLYLYTLTATSALLGPSDTTGSTSRVLRGPIPYPKEQVKQLRDAASDLDPHRILKQDTRTGNSSTLRLSADDHRSQAINKLRRSAWNGEHLADHGVTSEVRLWLQAPRRRRASETLELLLAAKGGQGGAPKWLQAATVALSSQLLDPALKDLDGILAAGFTPKTGIQSQLAFAVRFALGTRDSDGTHVPAKSADTHARAAITQASRLWLDSADTIVDSLAAQHTTELDAQQQLRGAALDALRRGIAPYSSSPRFIPSSIAAERFLMRRLP